MKNVSIIVAAFMVGWVAIVAGSGSASANADAHDGGHLSTSGGHEHDAGHVANGHDGGH